jgi:formate dehydrogenase iron-sulfur subunit
MEIAARGLQHPFRRTGSRGLFWLEPLLEVDRGDGAGRVAFGPVGAPDVPSVLAAALSGDETHPLFLGPTQEIDFLKRQRRLTFARVGVTEPLDLAGYMAAGGMEGARAALALPPEAAVMSIPELPEAMNFTPSVPLGSPLTVIRTRSPCRALDGAVKYIAQVSL